MKTVTLLLEGAQTLLLHNAADSLNPFHGRNKIKKQLTSKRTNKTEEDQIQIARLEWEMGWYWSDSFGPVIPTWNICMSLETAARKTREGGLFRDGVTIAEPETVLEYDGPRDLDGLWGKGLDGSPFVDYRPTGQQKVRIMRCRPKLREWHLQARFFVEETILDIDRFLYFAETAGQYVGIGDYRAQYGRFSVKVV